MEKQKYGGGSCKTKSHLIGFFPGFLLSINLDKNHYFFLYCKEENSTCVSRAVLKTPPRFIYHHNQEQRSPLVKHNSIVNLYYYSLPGILLNNTYPSPLSFLNYFAWNVQKFTKVLLIFFFYN